MATPSPAEPAPAPPQPPAQVEHRDSREEFIPPGSIQGRYGSGGGSISQLAPSEGVTTLRVEGSDPTAGSYRPKTVPGSQVGEVMLLIGLVAAVAGLLAWRHMTREERQNFAGQDRNRD